MLLRLLLSTAVLLLLGLPTGCTQGDHEVAAAAKHRAEKAELEEIIKAERDRRAAVENEAKTLRQEIEKNVEATKKREQLVMDLKGAVESKDAGTLENRREIERERLLRIENEYKDVNKRLSVLFSEKLAGKKPALFNEDMELERRRSKLARELKAQRQKLIDLH